MYCLCKRVLKSKVLAKINEFEHLQLIKLLDSPFTVEACFLYQSKLTKGKSLKYNCG